MKKIKYILIAAFVFANISAQSGGSVTSSDAVSSAMGNTSVTLSNGVFAIGKNPANLILGSSNIELSSILPFPSFSGNFGSNFLNINEYNYFFTGQNGIGNSTTSKLLTESDKERLINLLKRGNEINLQLDFSLLSLAVSLGEPAGQLAFSINDHSIVSSALPVSLFELFLYGNEAGRSYSFKDAELNSWYLRSYSLTYANDITKLTGNVFDKFTFGVSMKYVQGFWYAGIDKIKTYFETTADSDSLNIYGDFLMRISGSPDLGIKYNFNEGADRQSNLSLFPTPAGNGFGLDIGFNAEFDEVWAAAVSVTDIGSITWNNETVKYSTNSNYTISDISEGVSLDSITNVLRGEGSYIDPFTTQLATALHIGVACDFGKLINYDAEILNVVFEYHQGFNNMPSNSTNARFALGVEYLMLDILPVRSGFSFGGIYTFNWSFGFGVNLGLVDLNFATNDFTELLRGNNSNLIGVSFSSRWKF